ncbi:hypothetical protein ACWCXX_29690 [Streptomyces sp. NPDC001732]
MLRAHAADRRVLIRRLRWTVPATALAATDSARAAWNDTPTATVPGPAVCVLLPAPGRGAGER